MLRTQQPPLHSSTHSDAKPLDSHQVLVAQLQEKVLSSTSLIYAVASLFVTIAVLVRSTQALGGLRPSTWFALVVPVVCFGAYFLRNTLSYRTRASAVLGVTVMASLIGANRTGLMGAGLWSLLLVVPVLTVLFFGTLPAIVVLMLNTLLAIGIATLWVSGLHPLDYDAVAFTTSLSSWSTTLMMATLLSVVMLSALNYLLKAFLDGTRQLRLAEAQARLSEERLATLISNLPGVAFRGSADGQRTMAFVSQGYQELTGFAPETPASGPAAQWGALIEHEDRNTVAQAMERVQRNGDTYHLTYRIRVASGQALWVSEQGRLVLDSLGLRSVEGIITDHSAQKKLEEILTHEAHTDALTGLANRRRFEEQLRHEWMHVQRYKNVCALLMVDVDHFKSVNDRWGHAVGDIVLRTLGEQCVLLLRDTDTIGRIGGEEFGVILPEAGLTEAMETAERLRQRIAAIVLPVAHNATLQFTVSIGCTVLDGADRDAAVAMARADHAMYQAKSQGRNRVESA